MAFNANPAIGTLIEVTESRKVETQDEYFIEETHEDKPTDPCTALWRAVIMQALIDAGNNFKRAEYKNYKAQAISWLSGNSDDFLEVCMLADMEPDYVKKMTKLALARNCKWRNDNPDKNNKKTKASRRERMALILTSSPNFARA
jgi:hypothetical protein